MGETIQIRTADGGQMAAYVARPAKAKAPGVVVIQEIFGVNAVMRGIADELASAGYLAVCPDLFWRIEPGVDITDQTEAEWKKAFALMNAFDADQGTGKVGCVGFCLGGKLAYLTAARTDIDASVAYYGVGIESLTGEAAKIAQPLLMHIAEEDQFVPKPAQEVILQALKNHPHITIHNYPGRDHAFARKGGEHYDEADAKLAGGRTLAFFQAHLEE